VIVIVIGRETETGRAGPEIGRETGTAMIVVGDTMTTILDIGILQRIATSQFRKLSCPRKRLNGWSRKL
jgi:hypothetical protein